LILLLVIGPFGCRGANEPTAVGLKDQRVTGTVVLAGGKPLTRGRVVFIPLQEPFMPLYGKLGSDGMYTLAAGGIGTSVSHGEFRVCIEPPGYLPGVKPKGVGFPARYLNESTSRLKATIDERTRELPAFELR
jgi:hypothetical protein